jgi:arylsulfatase A-like enzyme
LTPPCDRVAVTRRVRAEREPGIDRRGFLGLLGAGAVAATLPRSSRAEAAERPNFVVILADDQGRGSMRCYGNQNVNTPRWDGMAASGLLFSDFYASSPLCSPTRASLLTGCYPLRVGVPGINKPLLAEEITIAELLKARGYATGCIGKWHLGHPKRLWPTRQGFDDYFGITRMNHDRGGPLVRGEEIVAEKTDIGRLTELYTEEAIAWIRAHAEEPFFLYLAHNMPHTPLAVSERFAGRSKAGTLLGDVIETLDWSTGEILDALDELGLGDRTLVVYTSDNGGGHNQNAPLRGVKASTWEGGMRVPCLARWTGHVSPGGVCGEIATVMDFLPTLTALAGGEPPDDRRIDGYDIRALLANPGEANSPYDAFFYMAKAVRAGRWKYHDVAPRGGTAGALYDLAGDPGETTDVAERHPEVVERLSALLEAHRADLAAHTRDRDYWRARAQTPSAETPG